MLFSRLPGGLLALWPSMAGFLVPARGPRAWAGEEGVSGPFSRCVPPHVAEVTIVDFSTARREPRVACCIFVSRGGAGSVLPHVAEVNETSWLAGW